jgi:L-amino acid N-acyltransferase YncA
MAQAQEHQASQRMVVTDRWPCFRVVGIYKRHGKLEGEWRDCVIVERLLDEDTKTETR